MAGPPGIWVTHEAAKAIGEWLKARGHLHRPIHNLTLRDLEAMAANAISRFVVLGTKRIHEAPDESEDLIRFLLG